MDTASSSSLSSKFQLKGRTPNFSRKDETILVTLVRKYWNILESRKTINFKKLKLATWKKLELEFNALSGGTYRNIKALKNKYQNLKRRKRTQLLKDLSDVKDSSNDEVLVSQNEHQMPENISDTSDKKLKQLVQEIEDLTSVQMRCLLEEHHLKLQHMQERHEQTLMIQERESKFRMKLLEEEHKIKMDII